MRRRARTDRNHAEIVQALRQVGWHVFDTSRLGNGFPDLVIHRGGPVRLVELKDKGGALTAAQELFIKTGWPVTILRSVDEAINL